MPLSEFRRILSRFAGPIAVSLCLWMCSPNAGEAAPIDAVFSEKLPPYDCPCKNGFYSTIVASITAKDTKICNSCEERLCVPGFRSSMPIRTVMQPFEAPLVVVLLGAEGKTSDPLPKLWFTWLAEAGYHVLSFNSTLDADFINSCGRGVSGNIANEAECARDIIGAFLKLPSIQGKVKQVAVVGMSYGGIQALLIGKMAVEKKVDFPIGAIKAFSPPIDMMRAAELIDRWWREDRWNYTLTQIYLSVAKHKAVTDGSYVPLDDPMMRAGVSASFRVPFVEVVEANDDVYRLNVRPVSDFGEQSLGRRDYAATFGFTRFMREYTYPHWKDKLGLASFNDLNAVARLTHVVPMEPAFVETIIANDDPLNRPEDLEALKKVAGSARLTILDGGGHLGYISHRWTKAKLQSLFKN